MARGLNLTQYRRVLTAGLAAIPVVWILGRTILSGQSMLLISLLASLLSVEWLRTDAKLRAVRLNPPWFLAALVFNLFGLISYLAYTRSWRRRIVLACYALVYFFAVVLAALFAEIQGLLPVISPESPFKRDAGSLLVFGFLVLIDLLLLASIRWLDRRWR